MLLQNLSLKGTTPYIRAATQKIQILKKFLLTVFSLIIFSGLFAQSRNIQTEINGTFANCSNKTIYIVNGKSRDSLTTDKFGIFQFITKDLMEPGVAYIVIENLVSTPFYLAPGFHLSIKADAANRASFQNTFEISGRGAQANQFWIRLNHFTNNFSIQPLTDNWYDIPFREFIDKGLNIRKSENLLNRIYQEVSNESNNEPYTEYFRNYSSNYLKYLNLWRVLKYSEWNELSTSATDSLIEQVAGSDLLKELNADAFLDDRHFKDIIGFDYLNHIVNKRIVKSESNFNEWTYPVEVANAIYKGAVKDYALTRSIKVAIRNSFSYSDLNFIKPYIQNINKEAFKEELLSLVDNRESELKNISAGKEAPDFNIPDESEVYHQLSTLKGKVVLIDLWASWCGPCKMQMPFLKDIYDKYRSRNDFQVISIAVSDEGGERARRKFIEANDFNWIHLKDENNFVSDNYLVRTIPRFILIDKKGKFITADAPFPGDNKARLMRMIDEALRG